MMEQTKFFIKKIPEYMRKNNGWLRVQSTFRDLTGQKAGQPYKPKYNGYNVWQLERALCILEERGIVKRYGNRVYVLTEKEFEGVIKDVSC